MRTASMRIDDWKEELGVANDRWHVFPVDMHGWSEGCVDIPGAQTEQ
jgi:hypothetical protein